MKARTDADRKLKLIALCDQCGAGIITGMKQCPDCKRALTDIFKAQAEQKKKLANQGQFLA